MSVKISERSRFALTNTPEAWLQVNLCAMPASGEGVYGLSIGLFDSYVGFETCKAVGIPKAWELTLAEALDFGTKLDKWLQKQESSKR